MGNAILVSRGHGRGVRARLVAAMQWVAVFVGVVVLACAITGAVNTAPFALLLAMPAAACAVALLPRLARRVPARACESIAVVACVQGLSCAAMLALVWWLRPNLSWDWGQLIRSASSYVLDGTLKNEAYFARYPNNQLWVGCLIVFFKMCHAVYPAGGLGYFAAASSALSVLLVQLSMLAFRAVVITLMGPRRGSFAWLLCNLYVPLWYYAPFAYSDTPAVLLCALALWLYVSLREGGEGGRSLGRLARLVALGAVFGLAYRVKLMLLVLAVAMLVDTLVRRPSVREAVAAALALGVGAALAVALSGAFASRYVRVSAQDADRYQFPPLHWVMMSLDYGGFVQDDVNYTASFDTYAERQVADAARLRERVEARGASGTAGFVMVTKAVRTWGNATLAGDDYVSRKQRFPESLPVRAMALDGDLHTPALVYAWAGHLLLVLGLLVSPAVGLARRDDRALLLQLAAVGIYLFFCAWECNSRYLVPFAPALLLGALYGWASLRDLFAVAARR